jgi:hypothetical protein
MAHALHAVHAARPREVELALAKQDMKFSAAHFVAHGVRPDGR